MKRLIVLAGLVTVALAATPLLAQQQKKDGQWGAQGCGYGDPRPECQPGGGKKDDWGKKDGGKKDDWGKKDGGKKADDWGKRPPRDDYGKRPPRDDYGRRPPRDDYGRGGRDDYGRGGRDDYGRGRDGWDRDRYRGHRHSHGGYWWRWVRELNRYEREDDYRRRRY